MLETSFPTKKKLQLLQSFESMFLHKASKGFWFVGTEVSKIPKKTFYEAYKLRKSEVRSWSFNMLNVICHK